jgi:hypothetical protein
MSHSEFDPIIDGLDDARKLGAWLIARKAKLDVSECHGLAATRLVVEDKPSGSQWCIPLHGAIYMVDIDDEWFATAGPADFKVQEPDNLLYRYLTAPTVEITYTGIDDETRRTFVDAKASATFELIPIIPNN